MEIKSISRPWIKNAQRKHKSDKYQSKVWKRTRDDFKESIPMFVPPLPPLHCIPYANKYCYQCWKEGIINEDRIEVDHTIPVKQGGTDDYTNLKSLCHAHHNKKTGSDYHKYKTN